MKKLLILLAAMTVALALLPSGAVAGTTNVRTTLDGAQEVPANAAPAAGKALVKLQGDQIRFSVFVRGMSGPAWGAHIHNAPAGANGPILVGLCGAPPGGAKASCGIAKHDKFRTRGVITEAVAAAWGTTVGDLWAAIQTGDTYINVHTDTYPGGEVRGQLVP